MFNYIASHWAISSGALALVASGPPVMSPMLPTDWAWGEDRVMLPRFHPS